MAAKRYWIVGLSGVFVAFLGGWFQKVTIPTDSHWPLSLLIGAPEFAGSVLVNVGSGLVGFFILLAMIEWRLRDELVQDVVRHALGYFLPEELQKVMRQLYDHKIVCTDSRKRSGLPGHDLTVGAG